MKIILSPTERRALRATAHSLSPVVMIGNDGLTVTVLAEIERSLMAHELIKIRVFNDDRDQREAWLNEICDQLAAAPIQHIGKLLVVWRKSEEKTKLAAQKASRPKPPRLTKREEEARASGQKPATRRRVVRKV